MRRRRDLRRLAPWALAAAFALLGLVITLQWQAEQRSARVSAAVSAARQIETGLEQYYAAQNPSAFPAPTRQWAVFQLQLAPYAQLPAQMSGRGFRFQDWSASRNSGRLVLAVPGTGAGAETVILTTNGPAASARPETYSIVTEIGGKPGYASRNAPW